MWRERRRTNSSAPVWDLMCCDVDYSVPPSSISSNLSLLDDISSLPPSTLSLSHLFSPSLSYLLWVKLPHEAAAAAAAALLSVWSLIADSHHFCQSQFIILNISLPHSIHLSLSLHSFVVVFFFLTERKKWFAGETELTSGLMWIAASLRRRQSQFITSAPRLSFCVPSCLFSERRMWSENYLLLM